VKASKAVKTWHYFSENREGKVENGVIIGRKLNLTSCLLEALLGLSVLELDGPDAAHVVEVASILLGAA
jgi:hypothetical protein